MYSMYYVLGFTSRVIVQLRHSISISSINKYLHMNTRHRNILITFEQASVTQSRCETRLPKMSEPICSNPTMIKFFLNVFYFIYFFLTHKQISVQRDKPKCHLESILVSEVAHLIVNNDQHRDQDIRSGCCPKKLHHCHTIIDVFPDCIMSKQPYKICLLQVLH